LGTVTPGRVVVVVADVEVVVGTAVVVVVLRAAALWWAGGELAQDERTSAVESTEAPIARRRTRVLTGSFQDVDRARDDADRDTTREMASSAIIKSFIQVLTADTSVGLNAVAVTKARWK
jgi:hypothetical protein